MIVYDDCAEHLRAGGWEVYAPDASPGFIVPVEIIEDPRLNLADLGAYVLHTAGFEIEGDAKQAAALKRHLARLVGFGLIVEPTPEPEGEE